MSEIAAGGLPAEAEAEAEAEVSDDHLRLAEALIFASVEPINLRALAQLLPEDADAEAVMAGLQARYAGRGVELNEAAGGWQFRTAPDLAPRLKRVVQVPRRLPRAAMETLAIVAYHQPVTRTEIEEIRGTTLSQNTLDSLIEAALITPRGRKEVPGRPTLWGTTPKFLEQFGLRDLRDLPKREDLIVETGSILAEPTPSGAMPPEADPADDRSVAVETEEAGDESTV